MFRFVGGNIEEPWRCLIRFRIRMRVSEPFLGEALGFRRDFGREGTEFLDSKQLKSSRALRWGLRGERTDKPCGRKQLMSAAITLASKRH